MVREIFFWIFGIREGGWVFLISLLPSILFLCYRIDKWIDKFNDLNKKKKIKKNFSLFLIKMALVIPIFLLSILDLMIDFKLSEFLREVLPIKGVNNYEASIIIAGIFPFIYVFILTYVSKKSLVFYYKKRNFSKS